MSSSTVTSVRNTAGVRAREVSGPTAGSAVRSPWHGIAGTRHRRAVHLTRRGRLFVVMTVAGLLLGAFAVGRSDVQAVAAAQPGAGATPTASEPVPARTTVQRGDTLWAIAQQIAPGSDPRDVVHQLRRLNDLPAGGLQAGQQLLLPVAA